MPTVRISSSLVANESVQNILAGSQFEFLGRPSRVQIYIVADIGDDVDVAVFFGQELQISASPVPQIAAATGPVVPDSLVIDDIGAPGDRLTVTITETAGIAGPALVRTMVVITPVA